VGSALYVQWMCSAQVYEFHGNRWSLFFLLSNCHKRDKMHCPHSSLICLPKSQHSSRLSFPVWHLHTAGLHLGLNSALVSLNTLRLAWIALQLAC